jgi:exonuclease VII large subunit
LICIQSEDYEKNRDKSDKASDTEAETPTNAANSPSTASSTNHVEDVTRTTILTFFGFKVESVHQVGKNLEL